MDCENYCDYVENADFKYISKFILSNFISEYLGRNTEQIAKTLRFCGGNYQRAFHQWCSGLPNTIDTAEYYYNGSALDFLSDLLYIGFISIFPANISLAIFFMIFLIVFCKLLNSSFVTALELPLLTSPFLSI